MRDTSEGGREKREEEKFLCVFKENEAGSDVFSSLTSDPCWICMLSRPSWCDTLTQRAFQLSVSVSSFLFLVLLFFLVLLHAFFSLRTLWKLISTHSDSSAKLNEITFIPSARHRSCLVSPLLAVIHRSCSPFVLHSNFSASPETHYTHIITRQGDERYCPDSYCTFIMAERKLTAGLMPYCSGVVSLLRVRVCVGVCCCLEALLKPPGAVI